MINEGAHSTIKQLSVIGYSGLITAVIAVIFGIAGLKLSSRIHLGRFVSIFGIILALATGYDTLKWMQSPNILRNARQLHSDFEALSSVLNIYKLNAGCYPSTQQGLKALISKPDSAPIPERWTQLAKAVPTDPWGNDYSYRFPGSRDASTFEIYSEGRDGEENTRDDVSSQDPRPED